MKILPVKLIREADAFTIQHEPISDLDLMERAAGKCAKWISGHFETNRPVIVYAGPGNNGGDGLVIARMLSGVGFNVRTYCLAETVNMSPSCLANYQRLKEEHPRTGVFMCAENKTEWTACMPEHNEDTIIIDAIFGSGLTRVPEGKAARIIQHINESPGTIIAIDIPSGLFCDEPLPRQGNPPVVQAFYTLSFAPPKLTFFFPENAVYTGNLIILDIGISPAFIESVKVTHHMMTREEIIPLIKPRGKFSHKGTFGHALLICGSTGKFGAAVLSARACLRSGSGLVTVRIPMDGIPVLQIAVPEAMVSADDPPGSIRSLPDLAPYKAIGIGPGTGTSAETAGMVKMVIQQYPRPIVFDADAINILAENKTWLGFLPPGSILTPHPGEFERLTGKCSDDFSRNKLQRDFSVKYQCYIVLKGAHTAITTPSGDCWFNTTGNPGMATAGSGDVLTGIITGLLAQGFTPFNACRTGVFLHGLAGDLAQEKHGAEALIASDIIDQLGPSFKSLYGKL